MKAPEILEAALQVHHDRGKERDQGNERSMARAVQIFNSLSISLSLTERQGWLFMIALKLARAERSNNSDHYIDLAGYVALLGEHVLSGNDDDGWIAWHGDSESGPLNVQAHEIVEVKIREDLLKACGAGPKAGWYWRHAGTGDDVCAYRIVREESE